MAKNNRRAKLFSWRAAYVYEAAKNFFNFFSKKLSFLFLFAVKFYLSPPPGVRRKANK